MENKIKVKISSKSLRQLFHPCTLEFNNICKTGCEFHSSSNSAMVTIHASEEERIKKLGGEVVDGFLNDL